MTSKTSIVKFLDIPVDTIDQLCKSAEERGDKIMISFNTYNNKDRLGYFTKDYWRRPGDGLGNNATYDEEEEEVLTSECGQQIHSSKDIFQYDSSDDKDDDKDDIGTEKKDD